MTSSSRSLLSTNAWATRAILSDLRQIHATQSRTHNTQCMHMVVIVALLTKTGIRECSLYQPANDATNQILYQCTTVPRQSWLRQLQLNCAPPIPAPIKLVDVTSELPVYFCVGGLVRNFNGAPCTRCKEIRRSPNMRKGKWSTERSYYGALRAATYRPPAFNSRSIRARRTIRSTRVPENDWPAAKEMYHGAIAAKSIQFIGALANAT